MTCTAILREYHAFICRELWGMTQWVPGVVLEMADGTKWFHPESGAKPLQFDDAAKAGVRRG
jgi:hypothetical protein